MWVDQLAGYHSCTPTGLYQVSNVQTVVRNASKVQSVPRSRGGTSDVRYLSTIYNSTVVGPYIICITNRNCWRYKGPDSVVVLVEFIIEFNRNWEGLDTRKLG